MSTAIDDKIVRLKVEAGQFNAGIKSATNSLKSLTDAIKDSSAVQSMNKIGESVKGVDFSSLINGVRASVREFNVLGAAAGVALGNIAFNAINKFSGAVKDAVLGSLKDGFKEYELQLNSVQTILANTQSKGETIETVNDALDKLNEYADQTIYNFGEMTANIGRFTSAGVGLNDSVTAIKGLSNLAAASGSTSQQASTAMYQLSQALASGTVKLMDWNSVVNAGMGGQQFQEALKRTARAHGIAVDELIEKNGSFRDSLQEGWITSDIMIETLGMMTDQIETYSDAELEAMGYTAEDIVTMRNFATTALDAATKFKTFSQVIDTAKEMLGSGWAQTWRLIFGDYQQAQELWTGVGNYVTGVIDSMSQARNEVVQAFVDAGGRTNILTTLANLFEAVRKPLSAIHEAFKAVFSGPNGESIAKVTESMANFSEKLIISDEHAEGLAITMAGVFSVLKAVITPIGWAIKGAAAVLKVVIKLAVWLGGKLLSAVLAVGKVLTPFAGLFLSFVESLDLAGRVIQFVSSVAEGFSSAFQGVKDTFSAKFGDRITAIKDAFVGLKDSIVNAGSTSGEALKKFTEPARALIDAVLPVLSTALVGLAGVIGLVLVGAINAAATVLDWLGGFFDNVSEAVGLLWDKVSELSILFSDAFNGIETGPVGTIETLFVKAGEAAGFFRDSLVELFGNADISDPLDETSTAIDDVSSAAKNAFPTMGRLSKIAEWFSSKWERVSDIASRVGTIFKNAFTGVATGAAIIGAGPLIFIDQFARSLAKLGESDASVIDTVKEIGRSISGFFKSVLEYLNVDISGPLGFVKDKLVDFKNALFDFFKVDFAEKMIKLGNGVKTGIELVRAAFQRIADSDALKNIKNEFSRFDGLSFADAFKKLAEKLSNAYNWIKKTLSKLGSVISEFSKKYMNEHTFALFAQGFSVGGLIYIFTTIKNLLSGGGAIGSGLENIANALNGFQNALNGFQTGVKASAIKSIAIAIFILAAALFVMSLIPSDQLADLMIAMTTNILALVGAMKAVDTINKGGAGMIKLGASMVVVAGAVLLLALAAKMLSGISTGDLISASIAVIILGAALVGMVYVMNEVMKTPINLGNMFALVVAAGAVWVLSIAVAKLGSIPQPDLINGVIAAGILLVALGLYGRIGAAKIKLGSSIALLILSYALIKIAEVLVALGTMDLAVAEQGMIIFGGIILGIAGLFYAMSMVSNMMGAALAVIGVAFLLLVIGGVLTTLGTMPFVMWLQGAIFLAATLAIIVIALNFIQAAAVGAIGLVAIAIALWAFIPVIILLGTLPWDVVQQGLIALALALFIVLAAAAVAIVLSPGLIALSIAVIALGIAVLLASVGFLIFGIAMGILAAGMMMLIGTFYALGAAANTLSGSLGAILQLGGTLAVFGIMMIVFGAGMLVAAVGLAAFAISAMLMGVALMLMGLGFTAIMATAPAGVTVLKDAVEQLGGMMWAIGKAVIAAAGLTALGAILLLFGIGALMAGVGALTMSAGLALLTPVLNRFGPALEKFGGVIEKATAFTSDLVQLGLAFTTFGSSANSAANSVKMIPIALMLIRTNALGATSSMQVMATSMTQSFTMMGTTSTMFATLLSGNLAKATSVLTMFAGTVAGTAPIIGNAFASMGTMSTASLMMFVAAINTASTQTNAAMLGLAAVVAFGAAAINRSIGQMGAGSSVAMLGMANNIGSGATAVTAQMVKMSTATQAGSSRTLSSLSQLYTGSSASMSRFNITIARSVTTTGNAFGKISVYIGRSMAASTASVYSGARAIEYSLLTRLYSMRSSSYDAGWYVGNAVAQGITDGIRQNSSKAIDAASIMASRSLRAAKDELGIHSPSREFYEVGAFVDSGLAQGILRNADEPVNKVKDLAKAVVNSATDILSGAVDEFNPTITPVLDLSDIRENARKIRSLFDSPTLVPESDIRAAQWIAANRSKNESGGDSSVTNQGDTVIYNQTINSPKALNTVDIYRSSRRAISKMKGALNAP